MSESVVDGEICELKRHLREHMLVGSDKTKQSKTLSGPESLKAVEKCSGRLDTVTSVT